MHIRNTWTILKWYSCGFYIQDLYLILLDGTLQNSLDDTGGLTLTLMEDEYPWKATWLIHNYEATGKLRLVTYCDITELLSSALDSLHFV